jgi:5-methylcytosine-specific restriction endonuclease McrA
VTANSVVRYKQARFAHAARVPCRYCGRLLGRGDATVDHKWPRSRGGDNARENLTIACPECNVDKGSMTFEEFKASPTLPTRCRAHLKIYPAEPVVEKRALKDGTTWSRVLDEFDPDRERWKA